MGSATARFTRGCAAIYTGALLHTPSLAPTSTAARRSGDNCARSGTPTANAPSGGPERSCAEHAPTRRGSADADAASPTASGLIRAQRPVPKRAKALIEIAAVNSMNASFVDVVSPLSRTPFR